MSRRNFSAGASIPDDFPARSVPIPKNPVPKNSVPKNNVLTRQRDLHEARPLWADSPRIALRTKKTPSQIAAEIVSSDIAGHGDADADLFAFR